MPFIRLNKKFFNNAYWNQKRTFSYAEAWLDLINSARFEVSPFTKILDNGRIISIERGEIHASLRYLANRWGWGVDKTKRFIDKAIKKKEIERRKEQGESIMKLCNYSIYNPIGNEKQNNDTYTDQTPTDTKLKNIKKYIFYKSESEFLDDWKKAREKITGKNTLIKKLNTEELMNFNALKLEFKREDFQNAMIALFNQRHLFDSVKLRPTHFLRDRNIEKYLDCGVNNTQLFQLKNASKL